ncbi:DUF5518 domain-containing protein [Halocatena pleomorpha]|uniref:DUF5518 domain-containing protein n=1 Tax=Halocatena pleomorpha TaxID=1785090 RepID=A0A3P3RHD7_9EURY|nr:DUF5518 domain-containing protein [Halocatena pleomorpha]RRJ32957.1 hypothetical protein EIK79_03755 [Halocatena pleomorpha]
MIVNALIGAVITAVSWFVIGPVGPILGGGVAGYLEQTNGPTVGALSGSIASLPIAVLLPIVGTALVFVPDSLVGLGLLTAFIVFIGGLIVNAALGAIGGYLGVYVHSRVAAGPGERSAR